jgi:hypothetical protein
MTSYTGLQEKSSLSYTRSTISTECSDYADKVTTLNTTDTSRRGDRQRRVNKVTIKRKILDNVKMHYSFKVLSKGSGRTIFKAFAITNS